MPEVTTASVPAHSLLASQKNAPAELFHKFRITPNGLQISGKPTFEEWLAYGKYIEDLNESIHFAIGDWLNYGELEYGETYKKAMEMFNFDYQTLRNDKWISYKVPQERRRKELSFRHHQIVSSLESEEQEKFLDEAVSQQLTTRELSQRIKQVEGVVQEQVKLSAQEGQKDNDANLLSVKDAMYFSEQLLTKLDSIDFSTLSDKAMKELLRTLDMVEKRCAGISMEYSDE